ncbi:High-affinity nitrate transporter 2.2 [Phytophthora cinnamomi]|uniref:High-affinity nitrate transporter 2.2 n=1 Tax=Phytophthora cinnamomi TaxID=4785 RepID=UPI0035597AA6|nr:High-affinity nitrate transporter 2.2 [Phytophthora cinnamomi]
MRASSPRRAITRKKMAKRKFVSSKKNAPSRAISSKEAALHGRAAGGDGAESDSGDSAASSDVGSSTPLSSEDEQEDDDLSASQDAAPQPMAVEVMPASVGRGKQLRFPTAISRGKVLPTEGGAASDADDSDDESLLSVGDTDDDDEDRGASAMEVEEEPAVATPPVHIEASPATQDHKTSSKDAPCYPIKAVRARKRHRPDSEYYKQMSTYVRDCLLSVRHAGNNDTPVDAFKEESSPRHEEFRRRLAAGDVERVTWKEPPSVESSETREDQPAEDEPVKTSKSSKSSKSSKPSKHSKSSKSSRSGKSSKSSKSKTLSSSSKDADHTKSASSSNGTADNLTPPTQPPAPVAPSAPAMCEMCKKKLSGETPKEEEPEKPVKKEKHVKAEDVKQLPEEVKKEPSQATTSLQIPAGFFTITFTPGSDVEKLRLESAKLMDEARKLKHEGNRRGASERGKEGQLTQGKYYLRSGAKFYEYALKLQEIKVAYQEKNDARHAHSFGDNCITTLSQTSSLIESTIHAFQTAGSMRLAALGCKMASVVHLTVYRLQHRKLQSFYSELFTPGRSPESRENGLTPPIDPNSNLNSNSSKDAAMRKVLLKEMEHTLRGFEMWRRYETYSVNVLPRVTNPVILDPKLFFDDLEEELGQS